MISPETTNKNWVSVTIGLGILVIFSAVFLSYKFGQKSALKDIPKIFKPSTTEQTTELQSTPIDPPQVFAREGIVKSVGKNEIVIESTFRLTHEELARQEVKVKITKDTKFIKIEGGKEIPANLNDLKKDDNITASSPNNIKNQPEFTADFIRILK